MIKRNPRGITHRPDAPHKSESGPSKADSNEARATRQVSFSDARCHPRRSRRHPWRRLAECFRARASGDGSAGQTDRGFITSMSAPAAAATATATASVGTSNATVRPRVIPTRCPRREEARRELTTTGRCRSSGGFEAGRMSLLQCLLALGELHYYFRVDVALSLLAEVLGDGGG